MHTSILHPHECTYVIGMCLHAGMAGTTVKSPSATPSVTTSYGNAPDRARVLDKPGKAKTKAVKVSKHKGWVFLNNHLINDGTMSTYIIVRCVDMQTFDVQCGDMQCADTQTAYMQCGVMQCGNTKTVNMQRGDMRYVNMQCGEITGRRTGHGLASPQWQQPNRMC